MSSRVLVYQIQFDEHNWASHAQIFSPLPLHLLSLTSTLSATNETDQNSSEWCILWRKGNRHAWAKETGPL